MSATICDVARRAGVSVGTVSNVLNGKLGEYAPATLARVMEAIQELGYHPNRAARSLARGEARALGVCFVEQGPSLSVNPYLTSILDGVVAAASDRDYDILLFTRIQRGTESKNLPALLDRRIDALCVVGPDESSPLLRLLPATSLPFVVTGAELTDRGINWIDVDNAAGTRLAMQHLFALGHTRIAHLAGNREQIAARLRSCTFEEFMEARGLVPRQDWLAWCGFDADRAYDAARLMLAGAERPTAIFAANDQTALGTLAAARDLGIQVPMDLSIVGFDDIAEAGAVNLTTIRQPVYEIGRTAALWLISHLRGSCHAPLRERLTPTLVERGTTGPPPG